MSNENEKEKRLFPTIISASIETGLLKPEAVLSRYPRNATYPADLSLVPKEQHIITESLQREVRHNTPVDFTPSMASMALLAQLSTDSMLTAENQSSFNTAKDRLVATSDIATDIIREKYAKGLAVGEEVLDLMVAIDLDTAGLIMRTHPFQERPEDLRQDVHRLYEKIIALQKPGDVVGPFNHRTRVKMLDRAPGRGGLEAMLISKKADIATIQNKSIIVTERERFVIDVRAMPMKWRSKLRKLVSTWGNNFTYNEADEVPVDFPQIDDLYEQLLDLPNPENPDQVLRNISPDEAYVHPFSTIFYAAKAELTDALDKLDDVQEGFVTDAPGYPIE